MAQNAFRPYKGKWVLKEHTLKATAGAVEKGDLIMVTSGGITVELGTSTPTAIIGIAAEDIANVAATKLIRIWEPLEKRCEIIGRVTTGAIAVGDTDSGRTCDLVDHEGVATDTDNEHTLIIVKGTIATADGSATAGEGIFRIAQDLENLNAW